MRKIQPICVHFHIFKNAGSTVDWTLEKHFGKNALKLDDHKNLGNVFSADIVLNYLDKHPEAKAISSHQIRFPLPQSNRHYFLPMIFIRHPIDRAFSVYNFKRREVRSMPIKKLCDRAMLLHDGKIQAIGPPGLVVDAYMKISPHPNQTRSDVADYVESELS